MDAVASENAAFVMLHEASEGKDISNRYNSLSLPEQRQVLTSMRDMQSEMLSQFGNVELYDSDRDGILDDAKAHVKDKNNQVFDKDVYNPFGTRAKTDATPVDQPAARVERDTVEGAARAGQIILEEGLRGIGRNGRGPSAGDRIQRRMGQEAVRNSNRILRDVLGRR